MSDAINRRDVIKSSVALFGFALTCPIAIEAATEGKMDLALRIQRLDDANQIRKLMARFCYFNAAGLYEDALKLFALNTAGVSAKLPDWGVYIGKQPVRRAIVAVPQFLDKAHDAGMKKLFPDKQLPSRAGILNEAPLMTPLIRVAGDAKTAKGTWHSEGIDTRYDEAEQKLQAYWDFKRFAVDFIRERNQWKIWHLLVVPSFRTRYTESWVDTSANKPLTLPAGADALKGAPGGDEIANYSSTRLVKILPRIPEPYQTFAQTFSY